MVIRVNFKINDKMKENIVTFAISGIAIVAFYFFIKEFQTVTKIITKIIAVSMPFIIGFCFLWRVGFNFFKGFKRRKRSEG